MKKAKAKTKQKKIMIQKTTEAYKRKEMSI